MIAKLHRVKVQNLLRKAGLLPLAEKLRYVLKVFSLKKNNKQFIKQNPYFVLPPPHLAFDAYSAPDWNFYKTSGEATAGFLANDIIEKYLDSVENPISVYEWGCGPARVIRHLPDLLRKNAMVFGSDYNKETIAWCSEKIKNVSFSVNNLNPPLLYKDNKFDFIYCISVFTHLSEITGLQWANELYRVLKPEGVLLITTSGDNAYETELLENERKEYKEKGVVVRGDYEEGKKMYLARHKPSYVKEKLLKSFTIEEYSAAGFPFIAQDYWVARKKTNKLPG
ncbi:MAG TPA: class I SAM-dependent methyltransferase [Flavitalea sp.]|nr:class I SAM-dependent methyltransferase [Flavitalea sp.]